MARRRDWTEADTALADQVVDAVWRGQGKLVGRNQVARALGYPRAHWKAAVERITEVMPLAVDRAPILHPGHVLVRNNDHTYRLIAETDGAAIRASLRDIRHARTRLVRTSGSMLTDRPESVALRGMAKAAAASLMPDVMDAIQTVIDAAEKQQEA